MKMEMERLTPESEYDVYLLGKIVFLPDSIDNKAVTEWEMRNCFPHNTVSELESTLHEYEDKKLFKVHSPPKEFGKPKRYMIHGIKRDVFRNTLLVHLNKFKLDSDNISKIVDAIALQYTHGENYEAVIKWQDIYEYSPKYEYPEPFWELVFNLAESGRLKLQAIDYSDSGQILYEQNDGSVVLHTSEQIRRQIERPIVRLSLVDKNLQKKVKKRRSVIKYRAGVILTKSGKLQLSLDGKRHTIVNYKSQKNNTYRVAQALYDANEEPLTKSGLNLKTDTKTDLRTLVKNTRITGILEELFIVYGFDRPRTVCLKRHATIDLYQHEQLVEYVKTLDTSD